MTKETKGRDLQICKSFFVPRTIDKPTAKLNDEKYFPN